MATREVLPLAATHDLQAQQPPKDPRIGVLEASPGFEDAFHEGLRQFGCS